MSGASLSLGRSATQALCAVALLSLLPSPIMGQENAPGRIAIELAPPAEVRIGDRIPVRWTLEWEGAAMTEEGPRFPVWDGGWGPAEVLEASPLESFADQSGRQIWTQSLIIAAFETGELRLPSRTITVPTAEGTREIASEEVRITIASVLPPDEEGAEPLEPKPPAGLAHLPESLAFPIALGCSLVGLFAIAFWLARGLSSQTPLRHSVPLRPPIEELDLGLAAIDPSQPAEVVHVAISTSLRRFLGRRTHLPALESTTSELRRRLLTSPIPEELVLPVIQLLRACDQVKFARQDLPSDRCSERVDQARRLGRGIEEALTPRVENEETAA